MDWKEAYITNTIGVGAGLAVAAGLAGAPVLAVSGGAILAGWLVTKGSQWAYSKVFDD